jgi:hypothetical protein
MVKVLKFSGAFTNGRTERGNKVLQACYFEMTQIIRFHFLMLKALSYEASHLLLQATSYVTGSTQ